MTLIAGALTIDTESTIPLWREKKFVLVLIQDLGK